MRVQSNNVLQGTCCGSKTRSLGMGNLKFQLLVRNSWDPDSIWLGNTEAQSWPNMYSLVSLIHTKALGSIKSLQLTRSPGVWFLPLCNLVMSLTLITGYFKKCQTLLLRYLYKKSLLVSYVTLSKKNRVEKIIFWLASYKRQMLGDHKWNHSHMPKPFGLVKLDMTAKFLLLLFVCLFL